MSNIPCCMFDLRISFIQSATCINYMNEIFVHLQLEVVVREDDKFQLFSYIICNKAHCFTQRML